LDNLALACPSCNLGKADRTEAADPQTGNRVPLFNPRHDEWQSHFSFQEYRLLGLTAIGRATISAFDLNHFRRLQIRRAEALFASYPPPRKQS